MDESPPQPHPLTAIAFFLALIIFVFPTYTALLSARASREPLCVASLTLICFSIVLIPQLLAISLIRRNPARWRRSRLTIVTWIIFTLAATCAYTIWIETIYSVSTAAAA